MNIQQIREDACRRQEAAYFNQISYLYQCLTKDMGIEGLREFAQRGSIKSYIHSPEPEIIMQLKGHDPISVVMLIGGEVVYRVSSPRGHRMFRSVGRALNYADQTRGPDSRWTKFKAALCGLLFDWRYHASDDK